LGAIAIEKAGILRRGRPAVLAQQRPAAMRALRRACRAIGANCQVVPPQQRSLALPGEHQWQNAALATEAARLMANVVDEATVAHGLRRLRWPGRFEVVPGDPPIILDGAHNGASAEALACTLRSFAAGRPIELVIGINRDKDARAVLRPLVRISDMVWATQTRDNPRALDAHSLGVLCARLGADVATMPNLADAIDQARTTRSDVVVCITGSLMLVGQARATLGLRVA
jgi:dihydrofolate synthase/folylpolyglutamate synthase